MEKNTVVSKKEKPSVISTKNNIEHWKVNAYSGGLKQKDGTTSPIKFLGTASVSCYKEDDKGLELQRKALILDNLIDINRQRKTDTRNAIATGESVTKAVKELQKAEPELVSWMIELQTQKSAGKVDPELVKKIQAKINE